MRINENGYGFYTRYLRPNKETFLDLIKKAKLEDVLKKFILENTKHTEFDINKIDVEDGWLCYDGLEVDDYGNWFNTGCYSGRAVFEFIALAINNEIAEKTGKKNSVIYADDSYCDDTDAIVLLTSAPWDYRESGFKPLTHEEYEEIFAKWLKPFDNSYYCLDKYCDAVLVEYLN